MEAILIVGKDPLSDTYGFDALPNTTYGTLIPDRVNGVNGSFVDSVAIDESAGSFIMTLRSATNDLGTNVGITLADGTGIDLAGVDGVYTAGTPSTTFTDPIVAAINGVVNMNIETMTTYSSAATSDANTIVVTLDAAPVSTLASEWTVDIDAGTPNVVTDAVISGSTVTLTVTDAILTGEVVTVTHTARSTNIGAFADQAVTNNEV